MMRKYQAMSYDEVSVALGCRPDRPRPCIRRCGRRARFLSRGHPPGGGMKAKAISARPCGCRISPGRLATGAAARWTGCMPQGRGRQPSSKPRRRCGHVQSAETVEYSACPVPAQRCTSPGAAEAGGAEFDQRAHLRSACSASRAARRAGLRHPAAALVQVSTWKATGPGSSAADLAADRGSAPGAAGNARGSHGRGDVSRDCPAHRAANAARAVRRWRQPDPSSSRAIG
jgi:hypothetical protein